MKIYLGIDHGYGFMKTANHIFRNGVEQVWSKPPFTQHVVEHKNQYYVVGESGKTFAADKTQNLDYYALTLAAIAKELKTRNYSNKAEVVLGVGLPIDFWQAQKKEFREYLMQNATARFGYADEDYEIAIRDVQVYPQGYAAVIREIEKSNDTKYVIDGGSGTLIRLKIAGKVPVMTQCESIDGIGLNSCLATIRHEIRKAQGRSFDDVTFMNIMRTGDKLLPDECQKLVEEIISSYVGKVKGIVQQAYPDADFIGVTWCGGLAQVMERHGGFGERDTYMTDLKANALGFEYLAEKMGRKTR